MAFLRVIGWIFVPYVMIVLHWRLLSWTKRVLGIFWVIYMADNQVTSFTHVALVPPAFLSSLLPIFLIAAFVIWLSSRRGSHPDPKISPYAERLTYLGGHPGIHDKTVYLWNESDSVYMAGKFSGVKVAIPKSRIAAVEFGPDRQIVNTGGGLSLGGAVVGGAIFGPVGAIVGSRKRTRVQTYDRDRVKLVVNTESGMQISLLFAGGEATYQGVVRAVGVSI